MARVFSGIQPTGEMHLGNYLGAVRQWVDAQDDNDAIYCVVDLHAITMPYDPASFADRTRRTATILLAAGLDPARCTLFVQSHVLAHTELTWVLNCVATFGELRRMTQFKEKSEGQESVSVGLFDYPVLHGRRHPRLRHRQGAGGRRPAPARRARPRPRDPVQPPLRRHPRRAREHTVPPVGARVMDLQDPTSKMSKSSDSSTGFIALLDDPKVITKRIRSAVTDSETEVRFDPAAKPGVSNLLQILAATTGRPIPSLEAEYATVGIRRGSRRPSPTRSSSSCARCRSATPSSPPTPPRSTRNSPPVPTRPRRSRPRCSSASAAPPDCSPAAARAHGFGRDDRGLRDFGPELPRPALIGASGASDQGRSTPDPEPEVLSARYFSLMYLLSGPDGTDSESPDDGTAQHSARVGQGSALVAKELGLAHGDVETIAWAGTLHDIGKLQVRGDILMKPGPLDDAETERDAAPPRDGRRHAAVRLDRVGADRGRASGRTTSTGTAAATRTGCAARTSRCPDASSRFSTSSTRS